MIVKLNTGQAAAVDQMNRGFSSVYSGGFSQFINDILANIASGTIGIQSAAPDVDSICLGGGSFSYDSSLTSGLNFYLDAGRFHNGLSSVTVAGGAIALSPSSTNYVELDRSGSVSANTTSFTSGRMPLYVVVTGASAISTITSAKDILTLLGPAAVNGAMLSSVASTKAQQINLGSISATASFIIIAPVTGKLAAVTFSTSTAVAANDTNYWQISAINKGQAGAGTQNVLDTGAGNSTKATGGAAMVANAPRAMTLTAVIGGTELNTVKGDIILITFTAAGTPTTMAPCTIEADFSFVN